MIKARRVPPSGVVIARAITAAMALAGCGTSIVHTRSDASQGATRITAVVALPPRLGFGRAAEQRRVGRRVGDALIEATGGHAILAEELPRLDPELLADGVRTLGEDPARTLTFSVTAARGERVEALSLPGGHSSNRPVRRYADYTVRLDIRRSDSPDIIGSVETCATVFATAPEIDPLTGRPQGLEVAIEAAIKKALAAFAPSLVPSAPFPTLAEAPQRGEDDLHGGSLAAIDRLRKLESLYPELSADELASLASSHAHFLVVKPGRLAALGLARGDLVSGMGGQILGNRASFARTLARGDTPALSIDRAGSRFLLGQTLVARSSR